MYVLQLFAYKVAGATESQLFYIVAYFLWHILWWFYFYFWCYSIDF